MIQGSDCLLEVLIGDEYVPVLCIKSIVLNTLADLKETTTKGDGRYKAFDYDQLSARVTLESILRIQEDGSFAVFDFQDWQNQFMTVDFRAIFRVPQPAPPDKVKVFRGTGCIQMVNANASAAQIADGTVELQVTGQYFLEDAIPEYIDFQLYSPAILGAEDIEARAIVRLLDDLDNVVWTSEDFNETAQGWLVHPFDVTGRVKKGEYRIELITETNTEFGNIFSVTEPLPVNRTFPHGYNSQILDGSGGDPYDFTLNQVGQFFYGEVVPPPACVDVQIVGTMDMPDATEGTPYSYSFSVSGTAPFNISNVTKPEWLTITVNNTTKVITLSGMPPAPATGVEVAFDVTNCSAGIISITQEIDIIDIIDPVTLDWGLSTPTTSCLFSIYIDGVLNVQRNSDDTGQLSLNDGKVVQVTLSASALVDKTLIVSNNIDGTMYNSTSFSSRSFVFTAETGKIYTVIAEIG